MKLKKIGGRINPIDTILNQKFNEKGQHLFRTSLTTSEINKIKGLQGACQVCKVPDGEQVKIDNMILPANTLNGSESQCKYIGKNLEEIQKISEPINYIQGLFPHNEENPNSLSLSECINIEKVSSNIPNMKTIFRPLLNQVTPLLHKSCKIGEFDNQLNMPPAILNEEQELINIYRNNWAQDPEIIQAINDGIIKFNGYNLQYCMDGITLNYLKNPSDPNTGYNSSLEYPGSPKEIGFFAPRIIKFKSKSMMDF